MTYQYHTHQPPLLGKEVIHKVGSFVEVIQADEFVLKIYLP